MQKSFPRQIRALEQVFAFVSECVKGYNLHSDTLYGINLSIEELFSNMVRHAKGGGTEITIGLEIRDRELIVSLTDYDVDEFDLTKKDEVDIERPLHERRPGGLGIFMVKGTMDEVKYDYADRVATITLIKKLES
jgi:serine/threonine-protein kinase RsbW